MDREVVGVAPGLVAEYKKVLDNAVGGTSGMIMDVIATVDGFVVASSLARGWEVNVSRIAAMASSGHALGDAIAKELANGVCDDVIISTDQFIIVFLAVPDVLDPPLILGAAATKEMNLGTVLYSARACTRRIAEIASE